MMICWFACVFEIYSTSITTQHKCKIVKTQKRCITQRCCVYIFTVSVYILHFNLTYATVNPNPVNNRNCKIVSHACKILQKILSLLPRGYAFDLGPRCPGFEFRLRQRFLCMLVCFVAVSFFTFLFVQNTSFCHGYLQFLL